jgi:hypothetical protein
LELLVGIERKLSGKHFVMVGNNLQQGGGENFIMRSFMICNPHPILCG